MNGISKKVSRQLSESRTFAITFIKVYNHEGLISSSFYIICDCKVVSFLGTTQLSGWE